MARSFSGSTDQVAIGNYNTTAAVSLSCWANTTAAGGGGTYQGLIVHNSGSGGAAAIYQHSADLYIAYYVVAGGGTVDVDPTSAIPTNGTWFHVALTYDSVNGLKTFFNGVSAGTAAANGAVAVNSAPVGLAYDPGNAGRNYNGLLADAAEWNIALTAAEILALAKGARPTAIRPLSLIGYWPLTGLQSPEPDLSGKAHNGTLTGTTPALGPPIMQFTPRWPQNIPFTAAAAQTFKPAWAIRNRIVVDGIGI